MKIEEEIQKLVDEDQIQEALLTLDANEAKIHDKAWYYSERGWILGMLERYQEAFWSLNKALSLGQDDAGILSQLGWVLNKMEMHESALDYLNQAEKKGRDDAWLYREKGWTLTQLDKFEDARIPSWYPPCPLPKGCAVLPLPPAVC